MKIYLIILFAVSISLIIGHMYAQTPVPPTPVPVPILTKAKAQSIAIREWGLNGRISPISIPTAVWKDLFCVGVQEFYPNVINPLGFGPIPGPNAGKPVIQIPDGYPEIRWKGCGANYNEAFAAAKISIN